ncbi:MAG: O-antigen ligase family protein [Thermoleophilia bacterium]
MKSHLAETGALILVLLTAGAVIFINPRVFYFSIASHNLSVMTALTPIIAVGTLACVIAMRNSLKLLFLDLLIIAFMFFFLAKNILGPENAGALKFVVYGICLYCLAAITVQKRMVFQSLVLAIVLITSLCTVYGFIEYAAQDNFLFRTTANLHPAKAFHRIYSTLDSPAYFGAFLVQVLPFSLLLLSDSRKLWQRFVAITVFIWTFMSLFLTFSKGSWIAAIFIGGAALVYLARGRINNLMPILGVVAMCLVVVVVFWPQASTEVSVRTNNSVTVRSATWAAAARGIADNFWGGVGFHQNNVELHNYLDPQWMGTSVNQNPVDNAYLSFFMEQGVVGISLWIVLLGATIMLGVKASRLNANHRFWAFAALASVAGFAINSFTFDSILVWPNIMFFWISAGIIRGTYQLDNNFDKNV